MSVTNLTNTTWVFNDYPNIAKNTNTTYNINFNSNSTNYTSLTIFRGSTTMPVAGEYNIYYNELNAYDVAASGWQNNAYKTITITGGTDVENSNLISWIQENATQQIVTSNKKIIIHPIVNGEQDTTTNLYPKTNVAQVEGLQTELGNKQNKLTTSSVNDGTLNKAIGFDSNGNLVKGTASSGPTIPTPTANDEGKKLSVNSSGEYVLSGNANGKPDFYADEFVFYSSMPFKLQIANGSSKGWDGTLYSAGDEWDGSEPLIANYNSYYLCYFLSLYGESNTVINTNLRITSLSGDRPEALVYCHGNLNVLLDSSYAGVNNVVLNNNAFKSLFAYNSNVDFDVELPSTTLADYCYYFMFYGCTSLTTAPSLPATTLSSYCYDHMFFNCSSLTTAPELPATTLTTNCYNGMFGNCINLTIAPSLPATTLAEGCYAVMFEACYNLTSLPELPATTLASHCYEYMFGANPYIKLSTTQTGEYQTPYRIPSSGTGTDAATSGLTDMFADTGGTFTGTPTINTTYYTSNKVIPSNPTPSGSGPSFVNGVVGANNDVKEIKIYDSSYPLQSTVYGNAIKNTRNNVDCYINLPFHDFNRTGNTLITEQCTYKAEWLVYDISTGSFDSSSFSFDSDYAEDLMELINDYNSIYFIITDEYGEEKYYTLRASEMVPDDESSPTSYTIYATGIASNKENSSLLSGPIQATLVFDKEYDSAAGIYVFNLDSTSSSLTQLGGGGGTTVTFVDWS